MPLFRFHSTYERDLNAANNKVETARNNLQAAENAAAIDRKRADRAEQAASFERGRLIKVEQELANERQRADEAQREALETKQSISREKKRQKMLEQSLAEQQQQVKTADETVAKERERLREAELATAEERELVREAEWEAALERERADGLKQQIEAKKKNEQRQKELFPWRPNVNQVWSVEACKRLASQFKEKLETNRAKGSTFLLFGPTSHGKSSFGNGCLAALEDMNSPPTGLHVGMRAATVSKTFSLQKYGPHLIIDMPGIFEGPAIKSENIRKIVTGKVAWDSEIKPETLETPDQKTANSNTVECVIIILRYDCELPAELKRQIGVILDLCGEGVVSCHLVLTHLDVCDPEFKTTANLPNIYDSAKVLKAVQKMSERTGIPAHNISFVKNYTTELETDVYSKFQYLRILNRAKDAANTIVKSREIKAIEDRNKMKEVIRWGSKSKHEWTREECELLVTEFKTKNEKTQRGHNFLLFGPTSHGKSSFGNGCLAALEDMNSPPTGHHVGMSAASVSKTFSPRKYGPHLIIDMPGIFEGSAIKSENIRKIVTGKVAWDSEIDTGSLETPDQKTAQSNTVECVIIILKYDCEFPAELKRQIRVILDLCGEGVVSCHLVLTHLDVCDPEFKDTANLPYIYDSPKVLKAVQKMSERTGIPPNNISFVKNYTTETETDIFSKLQYLRILCFAKQSAIHVVETREIKAIANMNRMKEEIQWGPNIPQECSEEEFSRLKDKFESAHVPNQQPESQQLNKPKGHTFLLFGPTSHGKSSFANGCWTTLKDQKKPTPYHEVRPSVGNVSLQFGLQKHGPHMIVDMPGILDARLIETENVIRIVTGQVPWTSKISATFEHRGEMKGSGVPVDCVIIILKYDFDLKPELKRLIEVIQRLSGDGVLTYHLVLTHLDDCDPQFKNMANLPKIYDSPRVLEAVAKMSEKTEIPFNNISFVKNYTTETVADLNSKLQYIRILDVVKEYADTGVESRRTMAAVTEEYRNQNKGVLESVLSNPEVLFVLAVIFLAVLIVYFSN